MQNLLIRRFSAKIILSVLFLVFLNNAPAHSLIIDDLLKKYNLTIDQIEPIVIKVGTLAPDGTPWINFAKEKLIPHITTESRGLIKLVLYAGGTMGEDTDVLRKMRLGQLQGWGCTALGIFLAAPEASVLSLPMLFKNYEEVDFITEKFRPEIERIFEKRGYYLSGLIDTGFFYLFSKTKIETIDTMRKQKILTWFGDVETATLEETGIKPIKVSVPEVVTSLQTGLINADIAPPAWQMGTQAYVHTTYYITQPLFYSIASILLDKTQIYKLVSKYPNGFGNEIINLIQNLIKNFENDWKILLRDFEAKSLRAFEKSGMAPVDLHPEDLEQFHKISGNVWKKLEGRLYPKELLDKVNTALKEFRATKEQ